MKIARDFRVPVRDLTSEEDCKEITPDMTQKRGRVIDLQAWGHLRGLDAVEDDNAENEDALFFSDGL